MGLPGPASPWLGQPAAQERTQSGKWRVDPPERRRADPSIQPWAPSAEAGSGHRQFPAQGHLSGFLSGSLPRSPRRRSASLRFRAGAQAPGCRSPHRGPSECLENNNEMKTLGSLVPAQLRAFVPLSPPYPHPLKSPRVSAPSRRSFIFYPSPKTQCTPKINTLDCECGIQGEHSAVPSLHRPPPSRVDHARKPRQLPSSVSHQRPTGQLQLLS